MSDYYRLTIPTGVTKSGVPVHVGQQRNCISGSGPDNCVPADWCRVCITRDLLFTFGGTLSGVEPVTITGVDSSGGDFTTWETPMFGISTPCGNLTIVATTAIGGGFGVTGSIGGSSFSFSAELPAVCGEFVPGDPTTFIFPQLADGGNTFTVTGTCGGTGTITVTAVESETPAELTNYRIALDTRIAKSGKRVLASICNPVSGDGPMSGSGPEMYRIVRDTGVRKGGKRVMVGEFDPCCDGGPRLLVPDACCPETPRRLYVTFTGQLAAIGTVSIDFTGEFPLYEYSGFAGSIYKTWHRAGGMACGVTHLVLQCTGVSSEWPNGQWFITIYHTNGPREPWGIASVDTSCDPVYFETQTALLSDIGTCGVGRSYIAISEVSP